MSKTIFQVKSYPVLQRKTKLAKYRTILWKAFTIVINYFTSYYCPTNCQSKPISLALNRYISFLNSIGMFWMPLSFYTRTPFCFLLSASIFPFSIQYIERSFQKRYLEGNNFSFFLRLNVIYPQEKGSEGSDVGNDPGKLQLFG